MSVPFEALFTITLYRDGQIRVNASHLPANGRVADALRLIADSIDAGATLLTEELDDE